MDRYVKLARQSGGGVNVVVNGIDVIAIFDDRVFLGSYSLRDALVFGETVSEDLTSPCKQSEVSR